jgi:hypothetical protein
MKVKLSAIALLAMIAPTQAGTATLTDAEATYLDQLVIAGAVLAQRCTGYEANGSGGIQLGARLLGSTDAAMAMIGAVDATIRAQAGDDYDPAQFRAEVSEAAIKTANRVKADLSNDATAACARYGDATAAIGLLRRY